MEELTFFYFFMVRIYRLKVCKVILILFIGIRKEVKSEVDYILLFIGANRI